MPHRIVSLIASATEMVHALGCGDWLVGRSHECDYPADVVRLPACSAAKFDVHGDSREIDDRVKSVLLSATSVYNVDAALLDQLQPSVILTQTQCEVCAVSLKDVEAAVSQTVSSRPQVVALEPNCLADVWADLRRVGAALGVSDRAERLIAGSQSRLAALRERCASFGPMRPRVACIEWLEPLMAGGNWMPELVDLVGGDNLFGEPGQHSPWMTWDALVAADPDAIVILPCGFDIPRSQSEMHWLTDRPEWPTLSAVQNGRVYVTDGNQYFNRPGPRVVESAEILAEVLYPGRVDYGHEGTGWVRWECSMANFQ
ncbi:MAG: cobalamin-binding protein [Planctomycetaceae bacterium]|nr:cobalamin-binding protein [Planctomycetaceae bacterium]